MNATQVMGFVRHLLTFGGGFLVAKGYDVQGVELITGGITSVVGGLWSFYAPEKQK